MNDMEKAQLIMTAFPGRSDCYGAGNGACVKMPLTRFVAMSHITGRKRIGRYLLRRDGTTGALAVDIDQNDLYRAIEFRSCCQHYQLESHIERSKGKGYHVWWFFDQPAPALKARLVASHILGECELPEGVEIFPKQDFLKPGRYGSYINLPLFGSDVAHGRTVFLDPKRGYEPHDDQWKFLASRTMIEESRLDKIIELNALDQGTIIHTQGEDKGKIDSEARGLPCFSRMLGEGVDAGMRNEAALRLAVSLYRTGIPKDLAVVLLVEWNERNRPPLDYAELEKAISSGYTGAYGHGCFSSLIQPYCDPGCPVFRKHNRGGERGKKA